VVIALGVPPSAAAAQCIDQDHGTHENNRFDHAAMPEVSITRMTVREETDVVAAFYGAWNERDTDGITRLLAEGGSFADPLCRHPLSGEALRAYFGAVTAALPELRFTVRHTLRAGDNAVAIWSLSAVCKGALDDEVAAEDVPFVLEGVDVFELGHGRLRSVRRHFDRRVLAEQLGMQSIVEPVEVGTMTFGYSLRDWVSNATPAVLGMTWIQARNQEEKLKIRGYARRIIKGFHEVPGFLGVVTGFAGLHGFTFTAWENEDALRAGVHGRDHVEAMRAFHEGASAGVFTSVWQPLRLNRVWYRCTRCGTPNDAHAIERRCTKCGAEFPEAAPYV
jgi:ketosteroid isomerase-like protein